MLIRKSCNRALVDNYRPISLTLVKTLERLINEHIMTFLTDFNLVCDNQHGFRQSRSGLNATFAVATQVAQCIG